MDQLSMYQLSDNHPLRVDPEKPWPWKVLVGYRAPGARKIKATRSIYIRAAGDREAESGAMRQAREIAGAENATGEGRPEADLLAHC